jgi:hypothetical protein
MPAEYRTLVFAHEEVRSALIDYSTRVNRSFPYGELVQADFRAKHDDAVEFLVRSDLYDEVNRVRLEPEFVAAALIRYCFLHKVPLPRQAKKSLAVENGQVCLKIRKR